MGETRGRRRREEVGGGGRRSEVEEGGRRGRRLKLKPSLFSLSGVSVFFERALFCLGIPERKAREAKLLSWKKGGRRRNDRSQASTTSNSTSVESVCPPLLRDGPSPRPLGPQSRRHHADVWWTPSSGNSSSGWGREAAHALCEGPEASQRRRHSIPAVDDGLFFVVAFDFAGRRAARARLREAGLDRGDQRKFVQCVSMIKERDRGRTGARRGSADDESANPKKNLRRAWHVRNTDNERADAALALPPFPSLSPSLHSTPKNLRRPSSPASRTSPGAQQ